MALLSVGVHRSIFVAFLLASFAYVEAPAAESKRVVLLHSFGRDFKPWRETALALREELERQSRWPIDLIDQSLASARFGGETAEGPFVNYLAELYAKNLPDLIISLGAPAAAFAQRHRRDLFPAVPMLFTSIEQRQVPTAALTQNDTVV